MPRRIQLSRRRGWRKPAGAVVVTRASRRWGNPYRVGDHDIPDRAAAVIAYRRHLATQPGLVADIRAELAGRDLACWCPLRDSSGARVPCHADVLLDVANSWTSTPPADRCQLSTGTRLPTP